MNNFYQDTKVLSAGMVRAGSTATSLIITNLVLIASVILIILNQVMQGRSYSHFYFSLSTVAFIFFLGCSVFLLTRALSTTRIIQVNQKKEELSDQLQKASQIINRSVSITALSVIIYALVVSFVYFF